MSYDRHTEDIIREKIDRYRFYHDKNPARIFISDKAFNELFYKLGKLYLLRISDENGVSESFVNGKIFGIPFRVFEGIDEDSFEVYLSDEEE